MCVMMLYRAVSGCGDAVCDRQVELFTYNWPREKWEHLQLRSADLCQWTNARCSLLHSIVAQKLGLFHHQPFTRRHDQSSDQVSSQTRPVVRSGELPDTTSRQTG